jgi:hypothetical protein
LKINANERGEQTMAFGVGLMNLLAALHGTSVALATTLGNGGGSDEGDEGDNGGNNQGNFGEHFERVCVE